MDPRHIEAISPCVQFRGWWLVLRSILVLHPTIGRRGVIRTMDEGILVWVRYRSDPAEDGWFAAREYTRQIQEAVARKLALPGGDVEV